MSFLNKYNKSQNKRLTADLLVYVLIFILIMSYAIMFEYRDVLEIHVELLFSTFIGVEILLSIVLAVQNNVLGFDAVLILNAIGISLSFTLSIVNLNERCVLYMITYIEGFVIVSVVKYFSSRLRKEFGEVENQKKSVSEQNEILIEKERRLKHMAYFDDLTGTLNRSIFIDSLNIEIGLFKDTGKEFYVVFLDVDDFKKINDTLGHYVGDMVLKEFSKRIMLCQREEDLIGRLGGDEFGLLILRSITQEEFLEYITKIKNELNKPFIINGQEYTITASFGIAKYPKDGASSVELLRNADTAMYVSKGRGKNQIIFTS